MKLFIRTLAVMVICGSITQIFFRSSEGLFAHHPELQWCQQLFDVVRWPVGLLNIWLAVRLWQNPSALFRSPPHGAELRPDGTGSHS